MTELTDDGLASTAPTGKPGGRASAGRLPRPAPEAVRAIGLGAVLVGAGAGLAGLAVDASLWRAGLLSGGGAIAFAGALMAFIVAPRRMRRGPYVIPAELAAFLEGLPLGFYLADERGVLRFANTAFAGIVGRTRESLCDASTGLRDVLAADEIETRLAALTAPAAEAQEITTVFAGPDGTLRPCRIVQNWQTGAAGEPMSHAFVREIGEELAWQAQIDRATARFERFFNTAPLGMVVIDEDNRILRANTEFGTLIEAETEAQTGRVITDFVAGEDIPVIKERIDQTRRGIPPRAVTEIHLAGTSERVAQLYASLLADDDGDANVILYLIDATEQKNLELQFAQSQKMQAVGQLAGGVAHDFNNLLTAIIGFSDLLLMRHTAGDPSFGDIMQIKQNANRAANLVRQLLAFSRQQTLRTKVLVVTDVLTDISNLLRRLIGENIAFEMIHGRDLGPVKVDQGQLEQVIINLAVNARDAMPDGGKLTIRTANVSRAESAAYGYTIMPPADYVLIEVADTGIGIPKEEIGSIFEPFFTTKEVGEGTGLGLSTVYGIIKQTGGFIFAESEPGAGATFRIFLPVHQGAVEAGPARDDAPEAAVQDLTGKNTILLVEDEDAVRVFAARALRNKGYTVLEAPSGEAALDIVDNHAGPIDLVITDVVMPQMDGPTLVKEVRSRRKGIKVVFISGYTEDSFRKKVDEENISFLPKPFSLKQLAQRVKEALAEPA